MDEGLEFGRIPVRDVEVKARVMGNLIPLDADGNEVSNRSRWISLDGVGKHVVKVGSTGDIVVSPGLVGDIPGVLAEIVGFREVQIIGRLQSVGVGKKVRGDFFTRISNPNFNPREPFSDSSQLLTVNDTPVGDNPVRLQNGDRINLYAPAKEKMSGWEFVYKLEQ